MASKQKFVDFLSLLYNATYMPMNYIKKQEIKAVFPSWALPVNAMLVYKNSIAHTDITFDYFTTEDSLYIGIVRKPDTDEAVMIGPVSTVPVSVETIRSLFVSYILDEEMYASAEEFFERTPTFTLNQFLNIMALINKELNHEIIDVYEQFKNVNTDIEKEIGKSHSNSLMERKELEKYHDTYYFEQEYYGLIERGDVKGLETLLKNVPSFTEGSIAPDFIRQAKNIFITSITLATRSAIKGGLDIETAYQLSDSYIQEAEKMSDASAITLLNASASFDFANRVAEAKIPQGMSLEIFYCLQYISNHINRNITVEMIASGLNMDRSTLSKKFKRELGFNISSYIMRRKLEEAKSLLLYTDKTVSEISEYLCFSTQSYFQNVFKRKYGVTPKEYRKKNS